MSQHALYLDHAATTPVRPEVREAMLPYLNGEVFGNPSSAHRFGRAAKVGLERSRREVAEALGLTPDEVFFTSGGTEADNLAILGSCLAARSRNRPMLAAVCATEHKAVLAAAHQVAHLGGEERLVPVEQSGLLDFDALDRTLAERPGIVSVMWVNNETGVVQPIGRIAQRCREAGVPFHSDLVQAFGKIPLSLSSVPLQLATISGHKIGAPMGVGALLVRDRTALEPLVHGGSQQRGLRPGTENLAGIVGLARAATLAVSDLETEIRRLGALRDELLRLLVSAVPDLILVGRDAPRAPHVVSVLVPGADSAALVTQLDLDGIAVSGGSACMTGAAEPSHVLSAMGYARDLAASAVRLSLGRPTTREDIGRVGERFPLAVARVRRLAQSAGAA